MPNVRGYTPSWLATSPGADLFKPSSDQPRALTSSTSDGRARPRRTIAKRGTEAYIAVGKEIRWVDLAYLRDSWVSTSRPGRTKIKREDDSHHGNEDDDLFSLVDGSQGYRTIKTPLGLEIETLVISPNHNYMAVTTRHTVHVCVLPDSSHLTSPDTEPLKPRFYQVGPTLHVTSKTPLAAVLFHPLGVNGTSIVTVTEDANVRIWEFNPSDRWTFDSPTTSIDLKKLADGTSLDQDFSASTRVGFSPDSIEMQVSSACFPSRGSGGWSPMTLWLCMAEGDVYAMCPLLPSRWYPPPTLIPSLSVSIVSNLAAIEDDPEVSPQSKQLGHQQMEWMADIDSQEPHIVEAMPGDPPVEIYRRPARPGVTPKLQGPFEVELAPESDDDLDIQLTDIFVIGQKMETDDLMLGEEEDLDLEDVDGEGLSLSVICLLSTSGQLRVCLDMDCVQAQWLPKKKSRAAQLLSTTEYEEHALVTFQTLNILSQDEAFEEGCSMFSPDVQSRYAFYVTHASSITYVSLSPWVSRLATELDGEAAPGAEFRLDMIVKGENTQRERLYAREISDASISLAATVAIHDPDLGYLLLSATPYEPVCVILESPEEERFRFMPRTDTMTEYIEQEEERKPLQLHEPRPTFMPSYAFEEASQLPGWLNQLKTSRHRMLVGQEVKLSPVTLQLFTAVHRMLSEETNRLGDAAAELFRKCDSLQKDLHDQISKTKDIRDRVEDLVADDGGDDGTEFGGSLRGARAGMGANERAEKRIEKVVARQEELTKRMEALKKKLAKAGTRPLSNREKQFMNEVSTMYSNIVGDDESTTAVVPAATMRIKAPRQRFEEAGLLREELFEQAGDVQKAMAEGGAGGEEGVVASTGGLRIPSEIKKQKLGQVRTLLERETALVEGVRSRVERLSMA